MKKSMMSVLGLSLLMGSVAHAAVGELSFSQQLDMQKEQLRPQAFNFFSDRYAQVKAHEGMSLMSFKQQLDSQKNALRPQQFNPVSDAYMQVHAKAY